MDHAARMPASSRSRRMDRIEFRLLMLASFPFFLCVTAIARLRGESPEHLARQTTDNARRLFAC